MAPDDDDSEDLYDDEFDFVDDDDDDDDDASDLDDEDDSELDSAIESTDDVAADVADSELDEPPAPREAAAKRPARAMRDEDGDGDRGRDGAERDDADRDGERFDDEDQAGDGEPVDEYVAPAPAANFRVHIYEHRQFKRTIDRPFTAEDAEAFASEFNRTSKSYGRFAVAGKEDAKPRKMLDD